MSEADLSLADLMPCFTGVIPMVLVTVSAQGIPNVTYLSRAHPVDADRLALSNQFLSKSHRNLAENPRACILLVHPDTHEEFRVWISFEQTLRRGPIFERLRNDLSLIAALTRMQEVFRLAAADVYRVDRIERLVVNDRVDRSPLTPTDALQADHVAIGELCARLSRCGDLDTLVRVLVEGLDELLGFGHSMLMLVDETGERLFTIASHGYDDQGVGSEAAIGEGVVGLAAERCTPVRALNMAHITRYARQVRTGFERSGELEPEDAIALPGLAHPGSQMAAPALTLGQLVGALLVESPAANRFSEADAAALSIVASLTASLVERMRAEVRDASAAATGGPARPTPRSDRPLQVRHFVVDGSTFLDNEYVIKGVAGKLLWALVRSYQREGRTDFTNREMRLDPSLDLPDFRDNFESRLILLKRRLDERGSDIRIHKTGRGRFRIEVDRPLVLEAAGGHE